MSDYYVVYDSNGDVVTRYDSSINGSQIQNPPAGLSVLKVADQATMIQTMEAGWKVVNGTLVPPTPPTSAELLASAQTKSIEAVRIAASVAQHAAMTFTTAGGITAVFPLDPHPMIKVLAAYTHYVVHAQPLPSPFNFYDVNGKAVAMTLTDISAFFLAAVAQSEAALAKQATLIEQINSTTTPAAASAVTW